MHSSCKRDQTGAATHRRVQRAASRAGRSISRSPHRHCGGRRGRTALAHHFNNAPVAQRIEHRASNAEVAGEIPAGSTTHLSRRSPMQRQRAQTSSSAGASPAAGTTLAPVAQRRGSGLKPRSVSVRVRPGALHLNARVVQQQRHPPQKRNSASANLAAGTNGQLTVAQPSLLPWPLWRSPDGASPVLDEPELNSWLQ